MISNDVFFLATEQGIVCWNFKEHRQFVLNQDYALRLVTLSYSDHCIDSENPIDQAFLANNIITTRQDQEVKWGWDPLSKIFHFGTRDIPLASVPCNVEEWAKLYLQHCNEVLCTSLPTENNVHYSKPGIKLPSVTCPSSFEELLSKRTTFFQDPDLLRLFKANGILT